MKKTLLEKLSDKQFDAYCDYTFAEAHLKLWKEKNPTYETDLTLWVQSMNLEMSVQTKKHQYDIAIMKWGIEKAKENFLELNKESVSL
jgi:hypothetical protein